MANQHTPVFLPGESHGQRSLVGCSPRGHKESDTTESTHTGTELQFWRWKSFRDLLHNNVNILNTTELNT